MIELALSYELFRVASLFINGPWLCSFHSNTIIDPKDLKSGEEYKAIAVEGAIWPKTLIGYQGLAGLALQDGGVPPED